VEALVRGHVDDAYWWAREAIVQSPDLLMPYNTLGAIYRRHGNPREAEAVLASVRQRDPNYTQAGWTGLDLEALGVDLFQPFQVHDLLSGAHYIWNGSRNYVELNPHRMPAHIFRIRSGLHTERDFATFEG